MCEKLTNATSSPTTVYIVDDDANVRRSCWFMLTAAGFQPRVFAGGAEFLEELPHLSLGAVLLDVRMPDIDGFEVLQAVIDSDRALPVIVVTGFGDVGLAVRAMKLGAADFVEKPYDEDELIARIVTAVSAFKLSYDAQERRNAARRKLESLSPREREVLELMLGGLPNKLIAHRLQVSNRTVEMHRANMMNRLELPSFSAAIRLAITAGYEPTLTDPE